MRVADKVTLETNSVNPAEAGEAFERPDPEEMLASFTEEDLAYAERAIPPKLLTSLNYTILMPELRRRQRRSLPNARQAKQAARAVALAAREAESTALREEETWREETARLAGLRKGPNATLSDMFDAAFGHP